METPIDDGPWGARGVGEHVMVQTAPAIANALYDAVGIRFLGSAAFSGQDLPGVGRKEIAQKD